MNEQLRRWAFLLMALLAPALRGSVLYVAPAGSDSNPGTSAQPLATVGGAQNLLRAQRAAGTLPSGPVTVYLEAGYYNQSSPLAFTAADSGTAQSPVVFASAPGQQAYITGAVPLNPSWFALVTSSSPIWSRLDPSAQGQVYAVNLGAHGITDWGTLQPRGFGLRAPAPLELLCNGEDMTLARWPNVGAPFAFTVSSASSTQFAYAGTRPSRWTQASDIWVHGFWQQNYADYHLPVASINPGNQTVNLAAPPAQFGVAGNEPYYAYNLLEELDTPGEYYLDRSTGMLYFWPPVPLSGAVLQVSMLEPAVITCMGTSYLTFSGLIIEATRGPLVTITGGNNTVLEGCLLRNAGEYGAFVSGSNNGMDNGQVAFCGEEGVRIQGGDIPSLTAGNNYVSNSQLHATAQVSWGYKPAVSFEGGCGNSATHNLIDDLPHAAIVFTGNNHLMAYNEIAQVCQLTSDSGAIYTARSWAYRGNVIEYNYLHDLASTLGSASVNGVYLDDCMSGVTVFSNIFYNVSGVALFCGGGRDNVMTNNIVALSGIGHYNDDRGMVEINDNPGDSWNLLAGLQSGGISYQTAPWSTEYPACAALPSSWAVLQQGLWRDPQNSVFSSNVGWSNSAWTVAGNYANTEVFAAYASFANNNSSQSPLFSAAAALDRSLRPASLMGTAAGFVAAPFAAIGPNQANALAPTGAPPAPLLAGQVSSASQVALSWSILNGLGDSMPTGYAVQEQVAGGQWTTVASFGPEVDFGPVSGLAASTAYAFRVVASNALGSSESNAIDLTTTAAPPVVQSTNTIVAANAYTVVNDVGVNGTIGVAAGTLDSAPGSVRMYDAGDAIRINFSVPTAGLYQLGVRVRSGGGTGPESFWPNGYTAQLDGTALAMTGDPNSVSAFDPSFGGSFWGTMDSGVMTLATGSHSVIVTAQLGWELVDSLIVTSLVPAPVVTPASPTASPPVAAGVVQVQANAPVDVINDVRINGTVGSGGATADSSGSVRMYDAGDAIQINFTVEANGSYELGLRARSGGTTGQTGFWPGGYTAQLDGAAVTLTGDPTSVSAFDSSYGGSYWGTMNSSPLTLTAGSHALVVTSKMAWAIVEYLNVTTLSATSSTTVLQIQASSPLTVVNDVRSNGSVGSGGATADSAGSVRMYDAGDAIQIQFTIASAGSYQLALRARSGGTTGQTGYWPGGYTAKLDGSALALTGDNTSISALDPAYGGSYWGTMDSPALTLAAGTHTLVVTSAMSWAVVEYLDVMTASAAPVQVSAASPLTVVNDVRINGTVGAGGATADNASSVRMYDAGDAIQITFTVPSAGMYQLGLRARSGGTTGQTGYWPSGYVVRVDGSAVSLTGDPSSISALDSAYGGSYWGTMNTGSLTLAAGTHTVVVTSELSWAVAEYLEVSAL